MIDSINYNICLFAERKNVLQEATECLGIPGTIRVGTHLLRIARILGTLWVERLTENRCQRVDDDHRRLKYADGLFKLIVVVGIEQQLVFLSHLLKVDLGNHLLDDIQSDPTTSYHILLG